MPLLPHPFVFDISIFHFQSKIEKGKPYSLVRPHISGRCGRRTKRREASRLYFCTLLVLFLRRSYFRNIIRNGKITFIGNFSCFYRFFDINRLTINWQSIIAKKYTFFKIVRFWATCYELEHWHTPSYICWFKKSVQNATKFVFW